MSVFVAVAFLELQCVQLHSLRTYRTSVFPLTLSLSSWKFNRAASSLQNSSNSNTEENCYTIANPVSKTQNLHETEPACSPQDWTNVVLNRNSVLLLCLHISKWKFHRAVFIIRTTRANPAFKYIAYRTESSVGQRFWTELTGRVCLSVEPLEQIQCSNIVFKTQIEPVCDIIINERYINQISVFTFTLTIISNWKFEDRAAIHCKTLDL